MCWRLPDGERQLQTTSVILDALLAVQSFRVLQLQQLQSAHSLILFRTIHTTGRPTAETAKLFDWLCSSWLNFVSANGLPWAKPVNLLRLLILWLCILTGILMKSSSWKALRALNMSTVFAGSAVKTSYAGGRYNMPPPPPPRKLTFDLWRWKWCPSHVWRGLPLCKF